MKTKSDCRALISLYVNCHNNRTMWSTNLHEKICRWGRERKKSHSNNKTFVFLRSLTFSNCLLVMFEIMEFLNYQFVIISARYVSYNERIAGGLIRLRNCFCSERNRIFVLGWFFLPQRNADFLTTHF